MAKKHNKPSQGTPLPVVENLLGVEQDKLDESIDTAMRKAIEEKNPYMFLEIVTNDYL